MLRDENKPLIPLKDTMDCFRRCPREKQFAENAIDEIPIEDVEKFYEFLQGEVPEGYNIKHPPRLSPQKAFLVIYYLQEEMGIIPDRYERCITCNNLYDSHCEGSSKGGTHCDYHRRD